MFWVLGTVTLACLLCECACFNLLVDKPYQNALPDTTFKFVCLADVPLVGCQVMNLVNHQVFDLAGNYSKTNYWGTGLENGDCGVTSVSDLGEGMYGPISCRVRPHGGAWKYAEAIVYHMDVGVRPVIEGPRKLIVSEGSNVELTITTDEPLLLCAFKWPGQSTYAYSGLHNVYSIDSSKKEQGRCRLTLYNVTADMSGIIYSHAWATINVYQYGVLITTLIVTQVPSAPNLVLESSGMYNENAIMKALCVTGISRPVARITWLLGDDVIQGDPEAIDTEPWEYESANVTSMLSKKVSMTDNGKDLVCRVDHVGLPGGVVFVKRKITVKNSTDASTSPGLSLNKRDGVYNVGNAMRASCTYGPIQPLARISWTLDNGVIESEAEDLSAIFRKHHTGIVTRKVNRKLTLADNGKELACRVEHDSLPTGVVEYRKQITVRRPPVSSRYLVVGNVGIRLHQGGRSFDDAANICEDEGGYLAIPRSERIVDTMMLMLNATKWRWAFVGVHDLAVEGTWMTVRDERWSDVGEVEWDVGEPNNAGGKEDCAAIRKTGVLNDLNCAEEAAFFCEIKRASAAHCFWEESYRRLKSAKLFKVAAGKFFRDWKQRERSAQHRDVLQINVPERYRGRNSDFKHDIAVVRLTQGVEWTSFVGPVCLDWVDDRVAAERLSVGSTGTVVGWGLTLFGNASEVLQKTDLPYVDFATCFDAIHENVRKFYTDDKFCAGYVDKNTSVCTGDSGGGLVFPTGSRYYLRGVVSMGFTPPGFSAGQCFAKLYTGFTDVAQFLPWVKRITAA